MIISIKGESYDPEVSYIEGKVKIPIENLTLFDQKTPVFSVVRVVPGSVHHVTVIDKKGVSEYMAHGIKGLPISFEIQCIVNPIN